MKFDYFSCIEDNVIVNEANFDEHKECDKVGEFFNIKAPKKKIVHNVISMKLVNKIKEEANIKKFIARKELNEHKRILAQKRFAHQITDGEIIVNLLEMKI